MPAPTELWVQPTFSASTGVTFDGGGDDPPTISGGLLTFPDEGDPARAFATALETLGVGLYDYSITHGGYSGGTLNIRVANSTASDIIPEAAGSHNGQIDVAVINDQTISIEAAFAPVAVSLFSLTAA